MIHPLAWLANVNATIRDQVAQDLTGRERNEFDWHWGLSARREQVAPPGDWRVWLVMAGRGFGKTRAGAEWVRQIAEADSDARIAIVSSTLTEARGVMVEGESGLIACSSPGSKPVFETTLRRVRYPNGAQAQLFSAKEPEALRGPQHSHAWCDEIGKWPLSQDRATRTWDNLLMGLRLNSNPQIVATTTPRAVPLVQRLLDGEKTGDVFVTHGSTYDNAMHLPVRFMEAIEREFGKSQLARQEIGGELLRDIEGALWTRSLLEKAREQTPSVDHRRIVLAVDPPVSATGDECGIVVAALGEDGIARVLADCSVARATPDRWAREVASAAAHWCADRVVAEANQGGAMVESVLRAADAGLPVKLVHASRGKVARAEPVAALYHAGKVRHCGDFPQLEDQLCGLMIGGEYAGPTRSPDRADALVWALTELMLGKAVQPGVRTL